VGLGDKDKGKTHLSQNAKLNLSHMPSFFNGKRFFLTYAQCPVSKEDMLSFLKSKGPVKYYVIGQEKHQDGNAHLHVCVEFSTIQRHPVRWLDCEGHHPKKDDPRSWGACKNYCKKDGDFIEEDGGVGVEIELESILKVCEGEEQWMQYCVNNKITFQYARWFWDRYSADGVTIREDVHVGVMCEEMAKLEFDCQTRKAWIIKGPSGCGKTTWAKINAPKPALFVSHIDQLKKFVPLYHKSIIFDDVSVTHYPRDAQIHLLDFDNTRAIHCRHTIATIPSGVFKIFTCNQWPTVRGDEAIERRMRCFEIKKI